MKYRTFFFIIFLLFFFKSAKADFISLIKADQCETIVEIYIEDGHIRVTYEIGLKDWKYFKEVIPDEFLNEEIQKFIESQGKNYFFNDVFTINADGKNLVGEIVKQEVMPRIYRASLYTGIVDKNINVSKEILFVEIVYPLNNKPRKVVITPPLDKDAKGTLANIGFVTYHKSIPVNDLRYLSQASVLNLDWTDPWYSRFNNINLRRHHQSSLMSFLYVDPYEVRHEVLLRVKDLEEWIDFDYALDDYIEIEDQDALMQKIAAFLASKNIVTIDGDRGKPIIDKIQFVKWSLAGIQILEIKERMAYSSAVIGVIFAYPHSGIAQDITIDWELFSDRILEVPNVATDPAGPMPYILKKDDNILVWKNYLKKYKLPTITEVNVVSAKFPIVYIFSIIFIVVGVINIFRKGAENRKNLVRNGVIILIGLVLLPLGSIFDESINIPFIKKSSFSKPEAKDLVSHLLENTYRAFDFREEEDIYDKLAISNDEDLLADLYIQTKKSMVIENQGGIEVKVKDVEIKDVKEIDSEDGGLWFESSWVVKGDVGHWGHIHSRTNQYTAILKVKPNNGVWKLYNIDIIEEVRL